MTSCGISARTCSLFGSSQTRIEYWPAPNTVTLPTPGSPARAAPPVSQGQVSPHRVAKDGALDEECRDHGRLLVLRRVPELDILELRIDLLAGDRAQQPGDDALV